MSDSSISAPNDTEEATTAPSKLRFAPHDSNPKNPTGLLARFSEYLKNLTKS